MLGLHCCAGIFSTAVLRLLVAVPSPVRWRAGSRAHELSCSMACGIFQIRDGTHANAGVPMSPAGVPMSPAGEFLTTEPLGKP